MGEYGRIEQGGQVDLEQGAKRLDGQLDQGRQIGALEVSNVHVAALLGVEPFPSVMATETVTSVSSDSPWFWIVTSNVVRSATGTRFTPVSVSSCRRAER